MKIAGEKQYEVQPGESLAFVKDNFGQVLESSAAAVPPNGTRTIRVFFEVTDD